MSHGACVTVSAGASRSAEDLAWRVMARGSHKSSSMSLPHVNRSLVAAAIVGLTLFVASGEARADEPFGPCEVPLDSDPDKAVEKLENCIDQVNEGGWLAPTEIVFEGPQTYYLDQPLEISRNVVIHGAGQVFTALPSFNGTSIAVVGAAAAGPIDVTIEGVEFTSVSTPDVRGVEVLSDNTLTLDDTYFHDLETTTSGGCISAQRESTLFVFGGLIENCFAADDGGALFTEATITVVDSTELRNNEAKSGGAVYLGASGTFKRKLRLWDATLRENVADDGGAIFTGDGNVHTQLSGASVLLNDAVDQGGGLHGSADIHDSLFEGNTAGHLGGGAMLSRESRVFGSTFRGNDAWRGGGIAVFTSGDFDFDIASSTFVANTVSPSATGISWGAGIFVGRAINPPPLSTTYLRNCTLSENVATAPNGIGGGLGVSGTRVVAEHITFFDNESSNGRAIYGSTSGSTNLTLQSSIVANSTTDPTRPVCSLGSNYQSTTSLDTDGSCNVAESNVDPVLDPLANNGGKTETHLPSAPQALGTAACFQAYDQRGDARPTSGCDMGSVQQ